MADSIISKEKLKEEIEKILRNASLESTSTKKVIQILEKKLKTDLSEQRKLIDELVMNYVDSLESSDEESAESADETITKKKVKPKSEDVEDDDDETPLKEEADEDFEVGKRKTRKVAEKKKKGKKAGGGVTKKGRKGNGYTKAYKLSPALSELVGATELPRHEVVKRVWAIIKERQLFDPKNRQFAICDKPLYNVIGTQRFYTFDFFLRLESPLVPMPASRDFLKECNENVVKNMANEITRNCQAQNKTVIPEFVTFLIELFLLNPKYGKLFSKSINRNNLAYFVDECVNMIMHGGTSLNTLRIQFILQTNYDKLEPLVDKHLESINKCLRPLVNEILEVDPEPDDEAQFKKLFRKISIYIILNSGLGNPGYIVTLKEGMAALESVFSMDDLKMFVALPRVEKLAQLEELLEIVSGVRLFNRDCNKGGEGIPDLPFNLVDAGKACMASLSNTLISVMQRVNTLTSAIYGCITVEKETFNIIVDVQDQTDVTVVDYYELFSLLAFNRQYEVFMRRLLHDVEFITQKASQHVERLKCVLEELHTAVKYKAAVPVVAVFPLFKKLWQVWRSMQNLMYLVSTVNRLMTVLNGINEQTKIPYPIVDKILKGRPVLTDYERMNYEVSIEDRMALCSVKHYETYSTISLKDNRKYEFLGFCALCLNLGALVPSIMKIGAIKESGRLYGFCSVEMALKFSKDPKRYANAALEFARSNPHLINLLNIIDRVYAVKDVEVLVHKRPVKKEILDRDIQTEIHPIPEYHEKNYTWDMWEIKRRACQWATIVNCQTHSTQTHYSHLRSEIHCQTFEPRDKCLQTKKDCGVNTVPNNYYLWGLRGQAGLGQHSIDLRPPHEPPILGAQPMWHCACKTMAVDTTDEDKM